MTVSIQLKDINKEITKISKDDFFTIEKYLLDNDLASDKEDSKTIKARLQNPPILTPEEFAEELIYVILASGFSQKTAKKKYIEIANYLKTTSEPNIEGLLQIFNNKMKMGAILKIWKNKEIIKNRYYELQTDEDKLDYLETLPFIGKITRNHIGRNLGINVVKYDIWIVRLANGLNYKSCDDMFADVQKETNLPLGYIDVILWKSCQLGIFKIKTK